MNTHAFSNPYSAQLFTFPFYIIHPVMSSVCSSVHWFVYMCVLCFSAGFFSLLLLLFLLLAFCRTLRTTFLLFFHPSFNFMRYFLRSLDRSTIAGCRCYPIFEWGPLNETKVNRIMYSACILHTVCRNFKSCCSFMILQYFYVMSRACKRIQVE